MTETGFVHLHVHSEYSLLDGAARIEAPKFHPDAPTIFTEAARHEMPAVAVTDHGAMFGALRFFEEGRQAGIKPIIGVEAYVAPGSRFERNPGENEEKYHHLTLLAENETGYRNLLKLVSAAYLEGFYHRPRMDKELLAEHAEGRDLPLRMPVERAVHAVARRSGPASRRGCRPLPRHLRRGPFLHGAAGPRPPGAAPADAEADRARACARHPARRDERPALHGPVRREASRRPALHPAAEAPERPEAA